MFATTALSPSPTPPQIYRQFFTAEERMLLDASPVDSALSEISPLRVLLMRLFANSRKAAVRKSPLSLKRHLSMLAAFSHTGLIMASLARFHAAQFRAGSLGDPVLEALAETDPEDL